MGGRLLALAGVQVGEIVTPRVPRPGERSCICGSGLKDRTSSSVGRPPPAQELLEGGRLEYERRSLL
jgi:hypothetical protein